MQKNEVEPLPHTIYKNELKMDTDLNGRAKTIKRLEENRGENLHDFGLRKEITRCKSPQASPLASCQGRNRVGNAIDSNSPISSFRRIEKVIRMKGSEDMNVVKEMWSVGPGGPWSRCLVMG